MTFKFALAGSVMATVLWPGVALAHVGHIGELAGHSHWVGVAALAGAALVAGLVAIKSRKDKSAEQEPEEVNDTDAEPEATT